MAEAAGLAGLVLAVFGAFNNAIQCFDYVYLARSFDQDSRSATLKLDIIKLRLSRWGRSVGFDPMEDKPQTLGSFLASNEELEKAKELLTHIEELFHYAEQQSATLKKNRKVTVPDDASDELDSATQSLRKRLEKLISKNFKPRKLIKRTKWALYSEKHVRRLVDDIKDSVDGLLALFPVAQQSQKRLFEEEGQDLALDENVGILEPLIAEQDPDLHAVIEKSGSAARQMFNISFERSTNNGLQQGHFAGTQTNNFGFRG